MGFVNTGLALYTVVLLMTKLFIRNGKKIISLMNGLISGNPD